MEALLAPSFCYHCHFLVQNSSVLFKVRHDATKVILTTQNLHAIDVALVSMPN